MSASGGLTMKRNSDSRKELAQEHCNVSSVHLYGPEEDLSKSIPASVVDGTRYENSASKTSGPETSEESKLCENDESGAPSLETSTPQPPTKESGDHPADKTNREVEETQESTKSQDEATIKIILIGNPGVGKSTILNTLVGEAEFESGLSYGSGRTKKMKSYRQGEYEYIDTPGLEDAKRREEAAKEISLALRGPACVKLIFVVMLDSGRTRVGDLLCMDVVLGAVEEAGIDVANNHSIIINQCGPSVHQKLAEGYEGMADFQFVRPVRHVSAVKFDRTKAEEDNAMLVERENLLSFVSEAPTFNIDQAANIFVDVIAYEEKKRAMDDEISRLKEDLAGFRDLQSETSGNPVSPGRSSLELGGESLKEERDESSSSSIPRVPETLRRPIQNVGLTIAEAVSKAAAKVPWDKIRPL